MVINMDATKLRSIAQLQEFLDAHGLNLERLHGVIKIQKQQIIRLKQRLERVHVFTLAA